jgi:hypothetical protein
MNLHRSPHRPASRPVFLAGLAAALAVGLGAGCASNASKSDEEDVNWLVRHARYERAVRVAAERVEKAPDDARAQEQWRLATTAWHLESGRRLTFENKDIEALEQFRAAEALAPEQPQVRAWIAATLDKLAKRWVNRAIEAHAADDLDAAVRAYETALTYSPSERLALDGLARALLQLNYRRGMGESYYERGTRALNEFWLEQAAHHFSSTLKYDENDRAELRRAQADTLRAENRALIAQELEEQGQYAAARNEYRIATLFDPAHAESLAGLERMKLEERAAEHLREADRRIMKRDFETAERELAAGEALSQRQLAGFAAERERLLEARLGARYEAVLSVEADHRFEEAIEGYTKLIEAAPQGYFRDALARRDALTDSVARAKGYYDQALAETDLARRVQLLRQVLLVYPEYKDSRQLLAQAESALAAQPPAGGGR